LYNVAYNLASVPSQILLGVLQPAFVAAGAQMKTEPGRLAQAYLQMLATLIVLGLPTGLALALLAPDLMALLYGARWLEATPVLAGLLAAVPLLAIWGISTPVLWNTGRSQHEWLLQLPLLAVGALLFWIATPMGLGAAALAAATLVLLRAALLVFAALRALQLPLSVLGVHALRGLALAIGVAAVLLAVQSLMAAQSPALRLLASLALPALPLGLLLWLRPLWLQQALGAQTWAMALRFAPSLDRWRPKRRAPALHGQAP
jgi:O-antigen/teichoic acid export membrane protein